MKRIMIFTAFIIMCSMMIMPYGRNRDDRGRARFFEQGSFYLTISGYSVSANPVAYFDSYGDYYYMEKQTEFAPSFGAGFRAVKFGRGNFINLEFDYMKVSYDDYAPDSDVEFFNFVCNYEFPLGRRGQFKGYLGLGIGVINYFYNNNTEATLILDSGFKIAVSRNVFFKFNARAYILTDDDGDIYIDGFWDDYYGVDVDYDSRVVSYNIGAGIEIHF